MGQALVASVMVLGAGVWGGKMGLAGMSVSWDMSLPAMVQGEVVVVLLGSMRVGGCGQIQ